MGICHTIESTTTTATLSQLNYLLTHRCTWFKRSIAHFDSSASQPSYSFQPIISRWSDVRQDTVEQYHNFIFRPWFRRKGRRQKYKSFYRNCRQLSHFFYQTRTSPSTFVSRFAWSSTLRTQFCEENNRGETLWPSTPDNSWPSWSSDRPKFVTPRCHIKFLVLTLKESWGLSHTSLPFKHTTSTKEASRTRKRICGLQHLQMW